MKTKRNKLNGMFLAALLLAGLVVAAYAAAPSAAPAAKVACADCKDGVMCKACLAKHRHTAHAKLAGELGVALKNLSAAEKAVEDGKKSQALKSLARVRELLTAIHDRAKSAGTKPPAGPVVKGWTEDLDLAMEFAARTKRPIVLDFTGSDWCGWCIKLHDEVFSKKAFKDYADKNLVLVAIDFPRGKKLPDEIKQRNSKLAQKYGVRGFPTIVILDSTGEKELGRTGYVRGGPTAFIAGVKKIVGK
ncbi:MAG: thioredoxin family protein [Phycisphaerae bacterium]|jgi:protein disulfide-isomerase|nr:thioredoxin family protein [Phycisphaerae bacterium]